MEISRVSLTMPVTLEAAEKLPILSGRPACATRARPSFSRSMRPSASSSITTTSAMDSRQHSSLEWCS